MSEVPMCRVWVDLHAACTSLSNVFFQKVDIRLPGNGISSSHGARPGHQIIAVIKWIRTSRLFIKEFEPLGFRAYGVGGRG
jgi:hypothetical protein